MKVTRRQIRRIIESYYEEDYEEERDQMQPIPAGGQEAYELGFRDAKLGMPEPEAKKKAETSYPAGKDLEYNSYMDGYADAVQAHHFGTLKESI